MKIPKQISDSVRILVYCNHAGDELIKVQKLATHLGLTRQVALKLSNILRQTGFLETMRGPAGGVRLSQEAASASVGSVIRALMARPELVTEEKKGAAFEDLFGDATEAFIAVLDKQPLSGLGRKEAKIATRKSKRKSKKPGARTKATRVRSEPKRRARAQRSCGA